MLEGFRRCFRPRRLFTISRRQSLAGANLWWAGDPQTLPYLDLSLGHPMILGIRHLLTPAQGALLIESANRLPPHRDENHFWDQRVQYLDQLPEDEHRVRALMLQARLLIQLELMGRLRPPRRLWGDTAQLVRRDEGQISRRACR